MNNKPHHIGTLSPEMALLGLLYAEPGHGYDLHRKVISDLGEVWHLSQSQAYATLKRLESQGDVSVEEILQEKLPARQLLRMTSQGRKRFWSGWTPRAVAAAAPSGWNLSPGCISCSSICPKNSRPPLSASEPRPKSISSAWKKPAPNFPLNKSTTA